LVVAVICIRLATIHGSDTTKQAIEIPTSIGHILENSLMKYKKKNIKKMTIDRYHERDWFSSVLAVENPKESLRILHNSQVHQIQSN